MKKASLSLLLCLLLALTAFAPQGVFAEETVKAERESEAAETTEPAETYQIKTSVSSSAYGTITTSESTIAKGEERTITAVPKRGYGVEKLVVDGVSYGARLSHTFENIKANHTVKVYFKKARGYVYVMLDAGHYGNHNRSPVYKSYWESKMNWKLHLYLKEELRKYKNVVVSTTRASQAKDRPIYDRGKASAKYDLFLSIHSNAAGDRSVDYPLVVTQKGKTKHGLAVSFGKSIKRTMGTKQNYRTWQRLDKSGAEYYGVLRGAKAAGTNGMILEHSFHTNLAATKWLYDDANLKKMAQVEAENIAAYYGLSKTTAVAMRPSKNYLTVGNGGYNGLTLRWSKSINASGYKIYRSTRKSGGYKVVKTITSPSVLKYTNKSLTTGRSYYYKVVPYKTVSGSRYGGSATSVKSARVKPKTPVVRSKAGHKKVTVRWTKVAGASGYHIYRATKKYGKYTCIKKVSRKAGSYTNKKLKSKKTYYYKVRAYHIQNGKKVFSNYSAPTASKTR